MRRRKSAGDEGWLLSYADLITNLLLFFVLMLTAANISRSKMQQIAQSISGKVNPKSLESIAEEIEEEIAAKNLRDLLSTEITLDGLEISLNSGLVFDSGAAAIRAELEPVLAEMLKVVVPYAGDYSFAVEGHTDWNPVKGGGVFGSNWELSSARAIVVRDRLEHVGVGRGQIRIEGYADTKRLPEPVLAGLSDDERLARHRRVVVRIY